MNFRTLLLLGAAAGVIAGCSSSKQAAGDQGRITEDQIREAENSFRPSDHDPLPARAQHPSTTSPDSSQIPAAGESSLLTSGEMVQGFRVQAYASTSIDDARAKKQDLEQLFPGEWFYLGFDSPSYKIRAGNFINRFEADRFARSMIEKGFPDAWTVPERVYKSIGRRPAPPPQPEPQPEVK
jgi:hypothetical protein